MQLTIDMFAWIAWLSLFSYVLILFFIESIILIINLRNKVYIYNDKQHSVEHIVYSITYTIGNIMLLFWTFSHKWFEHWFYVHIIEWWLWYTLIVLWVSWLALLKHIKKERNSNI